MLRPAVARAKSVSRTGSVRSMRRPGSPSPACSWRGRPDAKEMPQQDRVGQGAADPAPGEPAARGAPYLARARRFGGERQTVTCARHRRERHGVRGRPVHRLGEIGEKRLDGAGGVRDLFGEQLKSDDLVGVG